MKYKMITDEQVRVLSKLAIEKGLSDEALGFILDRFDKSLSAGSLTEGRDLVQEMINSEVILVSMFAMMIAGFISGHQYLEMSINAVNKSFDTINKLTSK